MRAEIGTENVKSIIVDLFFAGPDTTASSLSWFLLYMISFPEAQRKCQTEIDEIIENYGPPSQATVHRYPYTSATLLETLRMASVIDNSLPHIAREDVVVGGYPLKKGSVVIANIRYLHLRDEYWGDPLAFRPERWLDPTDSSKLVQHSHFMPFSLGKRRCLGESLAKLEFSVFSIMLLRNFTFKMANPDLPPSLNGMGVVHSPLPYDVVIESRKVDVGS